MVERWFMELTLRHVLVSLLLLAIFVGFAWIFRLYLVRAAYRLARKSKISLYQNMVSLTETPIIGVIILAGLQLSLLSLPLETVLKGLLLKSLLTLMSLLGIYTGTVLVNATLKWYTGEIIAGKKEAGFSGRLLGVFGMVVMMVALLAGMLVALEIWDVSPAPITSWINEHGWRIALILLLLVAAIIAIGELAPRLVVRTLVRRTGEPEEEVSKRGLTLSRVLVGTGQIAVIFLAAFMILSELEVDIAPILAGFGIVGIAIGFGAQSLVKDVLAGLFIILENQYRVGDVVRIADVAGLVEDINLRRTILRDLDGIVHIVPNGEIRVASNFTKEWSRVNLNITVGYGEDLDHVISVINRVGKELAADPKFAPVIIRAPEVLRIDNFGSSGIEIKILGETKPIHQWDVTGELRRRLKKAFDEEGIEIALPHTKVYFGNFPYPAPKLVKEEEKEN